MNKNSVQLRGAVSWNPPPYFDLISAGLEDRPRIAFLNFNVIVRRAGSQPGQRNFPVDSIRVVAYGALAEKTYAVLEPDVEIEVMGRLQSRKTKKKTTILEVVAEQISSAAQLLPAGLLGRLRTVAAQRNMEVRDLLSVLLEPLLTTTGVESESDGGDCYDG